MKDYEILDFDSITLSLFQESHIISEVLKALKSYRSNEGLILAFVKLLAVFCSNGNHELI